MKKIQFNFNFGYYKCPVCGGRIYKKLPYCLSCGNRYVPIQEEPLQEEPLQEEPLQEDIDSEDETLCVIIGAQKLGIFTFTQLKKDMTPKALLNHPRFENHRYMSESPNDFYVFKTNIYPHLNQGTEINLNLDYYDDFSTENGYTIYFDRRYFSTSDINELKTYNFG